MKIYIGHDSSQAVATDVCDYSIHKYTKYPVYTTNLDIKQLRESGAYYRNADSPASTEFTYTRFLVPFLNDYKGWAMFVDSDFLFVGDVTDMWDEIMSDPFIDEMAVYCVRHMHYKPKNETKFWGNLQTDVPRKNWSSLMVFNCGHPSVKKLTPLTIANQTPQWLHRFGWCKDEEIGHISYKWNWLVGEYNVPEVPPKALHFTNGGPWNDVWGQDYEEYWKATYFEMTGKLF